MDLETHQKIKLAMAQSQRPMIVSHGRPDGDTMGAGLAMYFAFNDLGKTAFLFSKDKIEAQFLFFKEVDNYSSSIAKAIEFRPDFIFFVDCADLRMSGFDLLLGQFERVKTINIDHHASNTMYGDINLIESRASSACEVVYHLFKNIGIGITSRIATFLFLGIFTDTSNFSNAATTPECLYDAAELWRYGIFVSEIKDNLLKNKTISFLKLWGIAMARIKYNEELKIASTYVRKDDIVSLGLEGDSVEGLSNFLNANLNVETIVVLKELGDGVIRGSLRTTSNDIDLAKVAKVFGGGGHKKASGFSVKGQIKTIGETWALDISN